MLAPLIEHTVAVFADASSVGVGVATPDMLAAEVPVALVFNGISHAVMMATPKDLDLFALGFALSEGIVDNAGEVSGIDVVLADPEQSGLPQGMAAIEVQVEVSSRSFEQLKTRRRVMAGRTGCGVCGVESLAALDLLGAPVAPNDWARHIDAPLVLHAFSQLQGKQPLNAQSGALHAAGWASMDGDLGDVFEDVGRHNALDKLLGALAKNISQVTIHRRPASGMQRPRLGIEWLLALQLRKRVQHQRRVDVPGPVIRRDWRAKQVQRGKAFNAAHAAACAPSQHAATGFELFKAAA